MATGWRFLVRSAQALSDKSLLFATMTGLGKGEGYDQSDELVSGYA